MDEFDGDDLFLDALNAIVLAALARARCERVQIVPGLYESVRYEATVRTATRPVSGLLAAGVPLMGTSSSRFVVRRGKPYC